MPHTAVIDSESGDRFRAPKRYVGYDVCDPCGRKIGTARELFVNGEDEPEYITVNMGLFGLRSALVPVVSVSVDENRKKLTLQ